MAIDSFEKNGFRVFRIREDLGLRSDIAELENMVKDAFESGHCRIAVSFTPNSHLYSATIAILIRCISHAEEKGSKLTLVVPNESIMSSVMLVGLAGLVETVHSEDELPREP
jgi:ABC-type transporter Mla MlaB component